jgi:putative membrane protein
MASAFMILGFAGCASSTMKAWRGDTQTRFLTEAAHATTSEIEVSRLATERASDPRVRQYAAMMVRDHTAGAQQLRGLARAQDIDVPERPDEAHIKTAANLEELSGSQFDREYMSLMVADHAKLLSEFQDKAAGARDPQVRAWAGSQVPILQ